MQDVLEVGNNMPLVITGGYAVQAHQLVDRLSRDIDVATDSDIPMEEIATAVMAGLTGRGWDMRIIGVNPRSARMMATDPATGEQCELDILREIFNQPPAVTEHGPVLALDDVTGKRRIHEAFRVNYKRALQSPAIPAGQDGDGMRLIIDTILSSFG